MENFLVNLLGYSIKYIILMAVAVCGVFLGRRVRNMRDGKKIK